MKYSIYQQAIFKEVENTRRSILIGAVAGSGKTFSITEALKLISPREATLFLAFNKSIVEELKERTPAHVRVSTLHSFGFSSSIKNLGTIKVAENKVWKWIEICGKKWDTRDEELFQYGYRVSRIVELMRLTLSETDDELEQMCDKFGLMVYRDELIHAREVLSCMNRDLAYFDFADMIYQPATKAMRLFKFDNVFVDECQDLNRAQQALLKKVVKPRGGRAIMVGDPRQAIYGFAGADVESYNRMKTMFPNTVELPLSVCYRCAKSVVRHAQEVNPSIQFHEDKEEGEVREGSWTELHDGDWVLCRNNKPLAELLMVLLERGIKAKLKGKDLGQNLINMLNRTKATTMAAAYKQLEKEKIMITIKLKKKKVRKPEKHPKFVDFCEKVDVIKVLTKDQKTVKDAVRRIESVFTDEKEGIILSSIHRSKGLEANRVFVICRELMPSPWAEQEHEKVQEANLEYVMITRAKKELIYVTDFPLDRTQSDPKDGNEVVDLIVKEEAV